MCRRKGKNSLFSGSTPASGVRGLASSRGADAGRTLSESGCRSSRSFALSAPVCAQPSGMLPSNDPVRSSVHSAPIIVIVIGTRVLTLAAQSGREGDPLKHRRGRQRDLPWGVPAKDSCGTSAVFPACIRAGFEQLPTEPLTRSKGLRKRVLPFATRWLSLPWLPGPECNLGAARVEKWEAAAGEALAAREIRSHIDIPE
jgi:hypothetical protein